MTVLRCAVYARFSSDRQSPASIADQIRKCREYAVKQGWLILEDHSYLDEAISGATDDRPGLQRALAAALSPSHPFDVLLVDDTSRLSRSLSDAVRIFERLNFAGVRVVAVSQGIDTQSEQADVLMTVHGLVDSLYIKELAKKTHRGMEGMALKGLHTGGRCFAYRSVRGEDGVRLEVEPEAAVTVRRIFELYAAGYSLKRIAHKLNAERVPSPQPRKGREHSWAPGAVLYILLNEWYTGRVVWNRNRKIRNPATGRRIWRHRPEVEWRRFDAPHLRIVSEELWKRVQARFEEVRRRAGSNGRPGLARNWNLIGSRYLFSGLLRCGVCRGSVSLVSGAGRNAHARYGCPAHRFRGTCLNRQTVRVDVLEDSLLRHLQEAVLRPEIVEYTLERFRAELRSRMQALDGEAAQLRGRRTSLRTEIHRLTEALAGGSNAPAAVLAAIMSVRKSLRTSKQGFSVRARTWTLGSRKLGTLP